jgi:diguanylate cyclase (GGDEF)-like protein
MFREFLTREIQRSIRSREPLSLVMIDVDHFKVYNDSNGHEAGNDALCIVARLLSESVRSVDIAARYGGEEFALILPDTMKTAAHKIAEQARVAIEGYDFDHRKSQPGGRVTISAGVATFPGDAEDVEHLVRNADRALYFAKGDGRNCVELYGHDRRSYQRVTANLDGSFRILALEQSTLRTLDVSEGGILFLAEERLEIDALVEVTLKVCSSEPALRIWGQVVSRREATDSRFETGLRILEMNSQDRERFRRYLGHEAVRARSQ